MSSASSSSAASAMIMSTAPTYAPCKPQSIIHQIRRIERKLVRSLSRSGSFTSSRRKSRSCSLPRGKKQGSPSSSPSSSSKKFETNPIVKSFSTGMVDDSIHLRQVQHQQQQERKQRHRRRNQKERKRPLDPRRHSSMANIAIVSASTAARNAQWNDDDQATVITERSKAPSMSSLSSLSTATEGLSVAKDYSRYEGKSLVVDHLRTINPARNDMTIGCSSHHSDTTGTTSTAASSTMLSASLLASSSSTPDLLATVERYPYEDTIATCQCNDDGSTPTFVDDVYRTVNQNEFMSECLMDNVFFGAGGGGGSDNDHCEKINLLPNPTCVFFVHFFTKDLPVSDSVDRHLRLAALASKRAAALSSRRRRGGSRHRRRRTGGTNKYYDEEPPVLPSFQYLRIEHRSAPFMTSKFKVRPNESTVLAFQDGRIIDRIILSSTSFRPYLTTSSGPFSSTVDSQTLDNWLSRIEYTTCQQQKKIERQREKQERTLKSCSSHSSTTTSNHHDRKNKTTGTTTTTTSNQNRILSFDELLALHQSSRK